LSAYLGIDIGSRAVKVVVLDGEGHILARRLAPAGYDGPAVAARLVEEACAQAGVVRSEILFSMATGYGRGRCSVADAESSEITCHARGARFLVPDARTVIDVGGQDSKVIRIDDAGRVLDFVMNDRCAAGTGRFLEVMAEALGLAVDELATLHAQAQSPAPVSSTCTVFAESEVISHLAQGVPRADIVAGLHAAIAGRVLALAERVGLEPVLTCTGGVALSGGFVAALSAAARMPVVVSADAQFAGALGAALLALTRLTERR